MATFALRKNGFIWKRQEYANAHGQGPENNCSDEKIKIGLVIAYPIM